MMGCSFRHVDEPEPQAVAMGLFVGADEKEKADVSGPLFEFGWASKMGNAQLSSGETPYIPLFLRNFFSFIPD